MSYHHKLRPQFHFSPKKNWMNDPNGCVYHNGYFHLFFQYHPDGNEWGAMHWGHAVSRDLIYWEEKEIALYPDEHLGMIFSGSGIVDKNNISGFFPQKEGMVFFYTSHKEIDNHIIQQQCIAYSIDDGNSLIKYEGNPVIPNPGKADFRDPKVVFHRESERWIMVLASGRQIDFYSSLDLKNWTGEVPFTTDTSPLDGVWECPDLFPLRSPYSPDDFLWVLTISVQVSTQDPTQIYVVGQFDGHQFTPLKDSSYHIADYGLDFYAAQSWSNTPGGKALWIGWCNNWNYAVKTPDTGQWRGCMSIPRELLLVNSHGLPVLAQRPSESLKELRQYSDSFSAQALENACVFNLSVSKLWDIHLTGINHSIEGRVIFHWDSGDLLELKISETEITLDRTRCGELFAEEEWNLVKAPLDWTGHKTDCRVLLDNGLIEIFMDSGLLCMTNQIFPEGTLERMEIIPENNCRFENIKGFPLRSIWEGRF